MYEHKTQLLALKSVYYRRLLKSFLIAFGLISFSLGMGVIGYCFIAKLNWIDALLNASMILGGMGPVDVLPNDASKLFASFYCIYSGIAFLSSIAVFLSPALHRIMHKLHIEDTIRGDAL